MADGLLCVQNILTYLGFTVAVFAFLSQYLTFPKDLLSELSRASREKEMPVAGENIILKSPTTVKQASNTIKVFFIEHDTITFITLTYLIFSDIILVLLLISLEYPTHIVIYKITLLLTTLLYYLTICVNLSIELKNGKRQWPNMFQKQKKCYIWELIGLVSLIALPILFFACFGLFYWVFLILILGLIFHFLIYIILLAKRNPVSSLLYLWEQLR